MSRTWTRTLLVTIGILGGILLVLAALVNTGIGHRTIAALIGRLSGGKITIEGLDGRIPNAPRAQRVELRDEAGTWLIIENAELDWSALALLRRHVDVSRFESERVRFLRFPSRSQGGTNFTVDVRGLRIGRLETAAEVSREPMTLEIQGSARYVSLQDWSSDLAANRVDGGGLYRLRASFDHGVLAGTADIEEPPTGFIAGLLRLNPMGMIELHATGSGPRDANVMQFTLAAGPLRATGQGIVNLTARTANVDFSAQAPQMDLRPDLAWTSLTAEGHLRGAFDNPDVNAELDIRNLRAQDIYFDTLTANVTGQRGNLNFNASLVGPRLPGPQPDLFAQAPLTARGTIELQTAARRFTATVSHPLLNMDLQGTAGNVKQLQANISLPRVAAFAGRGAIDVDGRANLVARVEQSGDEFRVSASGTVDSIRGGTPLSRLLGQTASVALNGTVRGAEITISDARLVGAAAGVQGSGRVRNNEIDLDWTARIDDLSLISPQLVGNLRARGQTQGPWRSARLEASGEGDIGTPRIQKQQVTFVVNAVGLPRTESGNFTAQGRFDNAPLSLQGEFAREQSGLKATVQRAVWKSLDARGDVTIPDSGPLSGKATLRLAQLRDIASVIGERIEGGVQGDIDFVVRGGVTSGNIHALATDIQYANATVRRAEIETRLGVSGNRPSADIKASATEIAFQDMAIRSATIGGKIDNPFDAPALALTLDAVGLKASEFSGNAKAQLDGRTDTLGIRFNWNPRDSMNNMADISTAARLDLSRQQIVLNALQAKYRDESATLAQPATVNFGREITVDRMVLRMAQGQVSLAGSLSPRLAMQATMQNVSAAALAPFVMESSLEGTISGTADLSGTLADPVGTVKVQGRGLRARNISTGVAPVSLDASAELRNRNMALTADLTTGSLLKLTAAGDVSLGPQRTLDLKVEGQGDLSILNPMLSAEGRTLKGNVSLNASVEGTLAAPRMNGRATLSGGEIQDVQSSLRIRDIAMTVEGTGNQIRVADFSGRAGDGTVSGNGTIDLSQRSIPVNFTVTARNAKPLVSDRFAATADANLRVTGAMRGELTVAGNIDVTSGEITLPEKVPPTIVVLNVRRAGSMPAAQEEPVSVASVRYDLTITTRGRVVVRGRGIDAEVDGATVIRGTASAPDITGGFDLRRGTFRAAGQTFEFTMGRVGFDGAGIRNKIDPTLNLVSENTSGGITSNLTVTGYASAPRIELSSSPMLPPDEILARILFQRSTSQLTAGQLAQVAQTAVALVSGDSGFDPLNPLRKAFGLSRLSIGSTETTSSTGETKSDTTVEAGTYVTRNVYVGAKQSLGGGTQAEVQVDLTKRLKAVGTVASGSDAAVTQGANQRESGTSLGLSYQFEY